MRCRVPGVLSSSGMTNRAAIEKAIRVLRAAGDDDAADDLAAELAELDLSESTDPSPPVVVVVETEEAGDGAVSVETPPPAAGTLEIIAAEAAADVARIEAEAAADLAIIAATATIGVAPIEAATAPADPVPIEDPEPRTTHWYYRPF